MKNQPKAIIIKKFVPPLSVVLLMFAQTIKAIAKPVPTGKELFVQRAKILQVCIYSSINIRIYRVVIIYKPIYSEPLK